MSGPKIGLALGGGIARGWAHIGVLRRLQEIGLAPEVVCGTSMGALVGGFYLANELERLAELVGTLTRFRMMRLLDFTIADNGIIGGKRLFRELEKVVGDLPIEKLESQFAAVATELATGHEIWLTQGPMLKAVRASVSLPGLFKPVKIDGRWLIDGALVNPVPVSACRALGARMVIAVTLTGDTIGSIPVMDRRRNGTNGNHADDTASEGERRQPGTHAIGSAMREFLAVDPAEPNFFGTMAASFNILLDRITRSRLAGDPPDLTIAPRVGRISLLDFHRADEAIEEGAKAVDRVIPELLAAIGSFGTPIEPHALDQTRQVD